MSANERDRSGLVITTKSQSHLIVRNPRVQGGEPVIRGTRVPVRSIAIAFREYGGNLARVGRAFSVGLPEVRAAMGYYRQHKAEIDRSIEQHERAPLS